MQKLFQTNLINLKHRNAEGIEIEKLAQFHHKIPFFFAFSFQSIIFAPCKLNKLCNKKHFAYVKNNRFLEKLD